SKFAVAAPADEPASGRGCSGHTPRVVATGVFCRDGPPDFGRPECLRPRGSYDPRSRGLRGRATCGPPAPGGPAREYESPHPLCRSAFRLGRTLTGTVASGVPEEGAPACSGV